MHKMQKHLEQSSTSSTLYKNFSVAQKSCSLWKYHTCSWHCDCQSNAAKSNTRHYKLWRLWYKEKTKNYAKTFRQSYSNFRGN